ncbi:protein transport protein SEC16B-like protein [Forsythia ovata]|uniref:Protein transport protein SEC16B-like protein n=1 Tax=Forsythia ovata TaxID=205694 RepID=A0ABD1TSE6_9LAMI
MWKPETFAKNEPTSQYSGNRQLEDYCGQNSSVNSHGSEEKFVNHGETGLYYENVSQGQNSFGMPAGSQNSVLGVNFNQQFNQSRINQNDHKQISNDYYRKQNLFRRLNPNFEGLCCFYSRILVEDVNRRMCLSGAELRVVFLIALTRG